MKFSAPLITAALAALPTAFAFPAYLKDAGKMEELERVIRANPEVLDMQKRLPKLFPPVIPGRKLIPDADHPFQAPGPTDQRGPCPGLNTMANHGYLSRTGITSSQELAWAMQESMGLSLDLAQFLGFLATGVDGNPIADLVSIGGTDSRVPGLLGGSMPGGIGRHNAYEIDSSLTRNDKYFGDNFSMNGTLYEHMFQTADRVNGGVLNIQTQAEYRNERYFESKATNPQFQFVPIGVLFFGADHFPWRTLVSTDASGVNVPATRQSLSSTYGAQSDGNGGWTYVPERYPAEWYRSAVPYSIPEIVTHAVLSLSYAATHGSAVPTGFDVSRATDPAYVACNMLKTGMAQIPSILLGLPVVSNLITTASAGFAQYNC